MLIHVLGLRACALLAPRWFSDYTKVVKAAGDGRLKKNSVRRAAGVERVRGNGAPMSTDRGAKYRFRYFFDPGSGCCLWSDNEASRERFGYPVDLDRLDLGENLWLRAL